MVNAQVIEITGISSVVVFSTITPGSNRGVNPIGMVSVLLNDQNPFNGIGSISKPVTVNTTGIAKNRLVRCFSYDYGTFVRAGYSDNAGNITFNKLNQTLMFSLVAYDNTGNYADVILSPVIPA